MFKVVFFSLKKVILQCIIIRDRMTVVILQCIITFMGGDIMDNDAVQITLRLSKEELQAIKTKAAKLGITPSALMTAAILKEVDLSPNEKVLTINMIREKASLLPVDSEFTLLSLFGDTEEGWWSFSKSSRSSSSKLFFNLTESGELKEFCFIRKGTGNRAVYKRL